MGTLYLVGYALGYVAMYPRVFRYMLDDIAFSRPDREDILFAGGMSLIITAAWPLIVLGTLFYRLVLTPIADKVTEEYRRG